ncbi:hypothetical protein CH72_2386 [Burkholderia ambifaria AMMD]|uniref:Uncharacterized protein n=1 Tax=Burkholderia ambifaria (strain ATCC BAA-244 / DSM 16087 / CCUG 44356 / LMG 19182 / AMMD) TaxID=339670 RepID=Q0BD07_BURCM|nr:hypothetical protein [Burkholderia ambifaria]ABI87966.1 hypothetical protein Bamb_2410 [Burkholderia ambifaria AMMD]AJY21805.1 hypothetical protein CH72_2386 [Burkholderia ambifaria AMMD]MBR7932710.1 hypothetical protein [Burkholderia ambifaria]PEH64867.1 hypothetical protein CRM91_20805 [Burkholderia ambifaria]QQC04842.1 hypothetical protein I6H84_02700 [Burkholderia ambifaria]
MARTQQLTAAVQAKPNLTIDAETISNLRELLDQRKKLDDAVNAAPAEISSLEAELSSLRQQMGALEADVVFIDETQLPAKQKQIKALNEVLAEKELAVRRKKVLLETLEARAPDLDEKIEIAIGFVRVEAGIASQSLRSDIAEELRGKVHELQQIYAKVRALNGLVRNDRTADFLLSALVPDLDHCMRVITQTGTYEQSTNLLEIRTDDTAAAEAEISEVMRPITEVLALARNHRPYVPLAKRPAPYVRKGAWDGPGGRVDRPEEPEEPPVRMKTIDEALAEPYEIKGDSSGFRTWKQAQEMNMTAAITDAQQSAEQ